MTSRMRCALLGVVVAWGAMAPSAAAQTVGVFRWQTQPYCNVVTLTVVAQGPSYLLTGSDDMCGAGQVAAATGSAAPNPDGSIALGFSVVTPAGAAAHITATVDLGTVSGTWTDADGNTGTFVFNPPPVAGVPPRPVPTGSAVITSAQLAASIFAGTGSATTVARSDHTHDDRYLTDAETEALVMGAGASIVEGTGVLNPSSFTPHVTFLSETVTTTKAGRLLISKFVGVNSFSCSGGPDYLVFLMLDGTPLEASYLFGTDATRTHLMGATTGTIEAGVHTVSVGGRCRLGTYSGLSYIGSSRSTVVVLP